MGYVPEDRQNTGLVLEYSVAANLALRDFNRRPFSRVGFMNFHFIQDHAEEIVQKYDIRLQSIQQQARFLSGGNQQKLILGRELEADPLILVAMQPCKGLDVGAIEFVQKTILKQRDRGKAILYISTELEHLLAVSDRVAVMFRGRITGTLQPGEATAERLGMLMSGAQQGNA
jgi:simple sugar transport system ATP-binding protein